MFSYEVLHIENGIYYIRYYVDGGEGKGLDLKLSREEFMKFIVGKIEK